MKHGFSRVAEVERQVRARKANLVVSLTPPTKARKTSKPNTHSNKGERNMFYMKANVRKHERALLFRDGDFVKFLEPGVYRFVTVLHKYTLVRFDITDLVFTHPLEDFLIEKYEEDVKGHFDIVETGPDEVAVVYHDNRITAVMTPADRKLFTKGVFDIHVDRFEVVDNLEIDTRLAKRLATVADAQVKAIAAKLVFRVNGCGRPPGSSVRRR